MNAPEPDFASQARGAREPPLVLVVDDERRSQEAMRRTLDDDFRVLTAGDAETAFALMERHHVDAVLCDQRMPGTSGVEFFKLARERWPDVVRILVSGYTDSQDIIAGINDAGIFQYLLKPWTPDHLMSVVKSAVDARLTRHGLLRLEMDLRSGPHVLAERRDARLREVKRHFDFDRIVRAPGSPLDEVCETAARVARYDLAVLVLGESGTGKELLAHAIHCASPRLPGPFVVVNCGAVPDTLLETELFGHKRGSFTGAVEDRIGLFQQADGGTLFLDEIGETSPAFQVKLLRVLQEGEIRPVGSSRTVPVDVRLVAATHRKLEAEVREGRFREDLYYRVAGITLEMPPLRERPGDIVPIAERLLADVSAELGRPVAGLEDDCRALLMGYPWPGNIRELRNELARALALSDETKLPARALSRRLMNGRTGLAADARAGGPAGGALQERLDAVEAMILRETMLRLRWNKTQAAKELGLSRMGLRAKLQRHGLGGRLMFRLLWLQSGGCGGCSMSLLNADSTDFAALLHDAGIELVWHPSLSLDCGADVLALLEDIASGRLRIDALAVEGALLRGPDGSGRFHLLAGSGVPMTRWVQRLAAVAPYVVAVGSCAAWGGISASGTNTTEACGLQYEDEHAGGLLGAEFRSASGLPVVNVAGCPTHPGWVVETLMALAAGALAADDLDTLRRPRFYADQLVHHGCTRNEYYEFKASAAKPSDLGCLMENMGCKGTQAHADCNSRLWNGEGSCTRGGYACISCTEPGFQDPGHPYHQTPKLAGIPIGLPTDMPKAWFVALSSLAKSATPKRVKNNAVADHVVVAPVAKRTRLK